MNYFSIQFAALGVKEGELERIGSLILDAICRILYIAGTVVSFRIGIFFQVLHFDLRYRNLDALG